MISNKILFLAPLILLVIAGTGATKVWAWDDDQGCCFHHWGYFHHWGFNGCGYGCGIGDFNGYQTQCCQSDDNGPPQTSSNQGTSVNVINSPGTEVNTYQSASAVLQPIVHGLCQLTQVNCNGDQGP